MADIEKRAKAARERADALAATALAAREEAREAAGEATALEAELHRQQWVAAQRELGVTDEQIDAERGIVTSLPIGPTYG